jgi:hypothetical protein
MDDEARVGCRASGGRESGGRASGGRASAGRASAGHASGGGSRGRGDKRRRAWAAGVAATMAGASVALAIVHGCVTYIDFCEPESWYNGTFDPDRVVTCCPDSVHPICPADAGSDVYCCPAPPDDGGAEGGATEADASTDGPIGACSGACVPGPPSGWDAPALAWIGPEGEAPPCPDVASVLGYEGHSGLQAPFTCGACECGPPSGACRWPSTLTAHAASCNAGGGAPTSFDPPPGWEGACTAHQPIAAGLSCGGAACVQSITIAPLDLAESGCAPLAPSSPDPPTWPPIWPPTWETVARVCRGFPGGTCSEGGDVCGPDLPPGFRRCVFHEGDVSCPGPTHGPYQERHVVFAGLSDTRSCAPCACGPPEGSACLGSISIFSDGACQSSLVSSYLVDSSGPKCIDLVSGSALGSKAATTPTYVPGACMPSGGGPMGSAAPEGPSTLCCIPSL